MIKLQFFRYMTAGGIALLVDISVFAGLRIGTGLALVAANLLGRAAGASTAFLINRVWTFPQRHQPAHFGWITEAWRYGALWLAATTVSSLGISMLANVLSTGPGIAEDLSKLFVETVVSILNFLVSRNWVFRSATAANDQKK